MRKWLVKVVEGRYRCWDDFLSYGMVSAGHNDLPAAPLKSLTIGDEIYAFLPARGYVGRGRVTQAAVLADDFVVVGDFVAKDGSGKFKRVLLRDILLLRRSDMVKDAGDPRLAEWVVGVAWLSSCPRKRAKRFAGIQEPTETVEELTDGETEKFLAVAFAS